MGAMSIFCPGLIRLFGKAIPEATDRVNELRSIGEIAIRTPNETPIPAQSAVPEREQGRESREKGLLARPARCLAASRACCTSTTTSHACEHRPPQPHGSEYAEADDLKE